MHHVLWKTHISAVTHFLNVPLMSSFPALGLLLFFSPYVLCPICLIRLSSLGRDCAVCFLSTSDLLPLLSPATLVQGPELSNVSSVRLSCSDCAAHLIEVHVHVCVYKSTE